MLYKRGKKGLCLEFRGFVDIAFNGPVPGNNCELIIIVIMV